MERKKKEKKTKKPHKKFIVSMAVDGRVDVTVEASDPQEAFEKATEVFMDVDLGSLDDVVDSHPVNATDCETGKLTDY